MANVASVQELVDTKGGTTLEGALLAKEVLHAACITLRNLAPAYDVTCVLLIKQQSDL